MVQRDICTTEPFLRKANSGLSGLGGRPSDLASPFDDEGFELDDAGSDAERVIGNAVIMAALFFVFFIIDLAAVRVIL